MGDITDVLKKGQFTVVHKVEFSPADVAMLAVAALLLAVISASIAKAFN